MNNEKEGMESSSEGGGGGELRKRHHHHRRPRGAHGVVYRLSLPLGKGNITAKVVVHVHGNMRVDADGRSL